MNPKSLIVKAEMHKLNNEMSEAIELWRLVVDTYPDTEQGTYAVEQLKKHLPLVAEPEPEPAKSNNQTFLKLVLLYIVYFFVKTITNPVAAPDYYDATDRLIFESTIYAIHVIAIFAISFFIAMWNCRLPDKTISESLPNCTNRAFNYTIAFCVVILFFGINSNTEPKKSEQKVQFNEAQTSHIKDNLEAILQKYADVANIDLPIMADKETRLEKVNALGDKMQFNYTLVNLSKDDELTKLLTNNIKANLVYIYCNSEDMNPFVKFNVPVIFSFKDKNGVTVAKETVSSNDCKTITKKQ